MLFQLKLGMILYKYYMVRGKIWQPTFPEVLILTSQTCRVRDESLDISTEGKYCAE